MAFEIENGILNKYKEEPGVTEIVIPDGVTEIGEYAFCNCTSLTSVTIPDSVTEIGNGAFKNCTCLTSIKLSDNLKTIGGSAFKGCNSLTSIVIPDSVTRIGCEDDPELFPGTFMDCTSLTSVTIPDSVSYIGKYSFWDCTNLETFVLPKIFTALDIDHVKYTKWYKEQTDKIGKYVIKYVIIGSRLIEYRGIVSKVTIPDGVTAISAGVFKEHLELKKVTIPASVTEIGEEAFFGCIELTDITMPKLKAENIGKGAFEFCGSLAPASMLTANEANYILDKHADKITADILYEYMLNLKLNRKVGKIIDSFVTEHLSYDKMAQALVSHISVDKKDKKYADAFCAYFGDSIDKLSDSVLINLHKVFSDNGYSEYAKWLKEKDARLDTDEDKLKEKDARLDTDEDKIVPANPIEAMVYEEVRGSDEDFKGFKHCYMNDKPIHYAGTDEEAAIKVVYYIYKSYVENNPVPTHISDYEYSFNGAAILEKADRAAAALDQTEFNKFIEGLDIKGYNYSLNLKSNFPILSLYCRYSKNEEVIKDILSHFKEWKSWNRYGQTGRKAIIMARAAIILSETQAAYDFAEKDGRLEYYAKIRGTDADSLRDSRLSSYGLDENGVKIYDIGGKNIIATLQDDLSFSLYDEDANKAVKSIPKKSNDSEKQAACAEDFKNLKKSIKSLYKQRVKLLSHDFISGKTKPAATWKSSYMKHALLSKLARLIVWEFKNNIESKFFTLLDGKPVLYNGVAFELPDEGEIGVAYPSEMSVDEVSEWQKYFTAHSLKQPFLQIWEPVRAPETIKENRYAGCMIPFYRFKNEMFSIDDQDFHNMITIRIYGLDSEIERIDWARHEIKMDDRFEIKKISFREYTRRTNHVIAYLDRITVWDRVRNDDTTVTEMLPFFTLAQITEFIAAAQEVNAVNVLAQLMEYKNNTFADFDPMDEFTLDW